MREAYRMQKKTLTDSIKRQEKFMAAFFISYFSTNTKSHVEQLKDICRKKLS